MPDPAIRAALDAAARATCCPEGCRSEQVGLPFFTHCTARLHGNPGKAAAAVAAFLRDFYEAPGDHRVWTLREIAAAVEAEAGDG